MDAADVEPAAGAPSAACAGRVGRLAGIGRSVRRFFTLARTATTMSTGKETSTAKASSDSSTRESEPKAETSAVPRVSAAKSASPPEVPIPASTNRARTRL